jgi:hypothetical protein
MIIQEKAKSIYTKVKGEAEGSFILCHGCFNRFRNHANLHNVNVCGEAARADTVTAEEFPNLFGEIQ